MTKAPGGLPGFSELLEFTTKAAQAATLLSETRADDVDLAATPRDSSRLILTASLPPARSKRCLRWPGSPSSPISTRSRS